MVRKWGSVAVATAMLLSSTAAAFGGTEASPSQVQQAALAPGKAAGVKQAQMMGQHTWMVILGAAVVVGGIILATSDNGNGTVSTTTTANP